MPVKMPAQGERMKRRFDPQRDSGPAVLRVGAAGREGARIVHPGGCASVGNPLYCYKNK